MQPISIQELLNWHSYLTSIASLSPKMKEVQDKIEEEIHFAFKALKRNIITQQDTTQHG